MIGITELDIDIDIDAALEYYHLLEKDFQLQKWVNKGENVPKSICDDCVIDLSEPSGRRCECGEPPNQIDELYGWGLETLINLDPSAPYHMSDNPFERDYKNYKKTINCIGWGAKAVDFFERGYRSILAVSPPNTYVVPHKDWKDKCKIHIPIQTNDDCKWILEDGIFTMPAGKAYLLDVDFKHGTINKGNINRIHLVIEVMKKDLDSIKMLRGKI